MLLTHRKLLQSKAIAIENDLRGTLRNFGLKVGTAGRTRFEARIKEWRAASLRCWRWCASAVTGTSHPQLIDRKLFREQLIYEQPTVWKPEIMTKVH